MNEPETLAAQNGFSHWAQLNMAAAVPLEAVRDMCADGRCGRYGHNWACPPGCGSIEAAARRAMILIMNPSRTPSARTSAASPTSPARCAGSIQAVCR